MPTILDNKAHLETYSLVNMMGEKLNKWNDKNVDPNSKMNRFVGHILKPLVVRVIGCVAVVFCALADLFMHLALFMAKLVAAPLVLPARICVKDFTKELHLASPIKHLINTLRSLIDVVFLPGLWLLDPKAAYEHAAIHVSNSDQNHVSNRDQKIQNKVYIGRLPSPMKIFALPPAPQQNHVDSDDESSSEEYKMHTVPLNISEDDETDSEIDSDFELSIRECEKNNDEIDSRPSQEIEDSFNQTLQGFQTFILTLNPEEQKKFDEEFNRRKSKVESLPAPVFKRWCASLKDFVTTLNEKHSELKQVTNSAFKSNSLTNDVLATPEKASMGSILGQLSSPAQENFQTAIKKVQESTSIHTIERELKLYEKLMKHFEQRLKQIVDFQRGNSSTTSEKQMEIDAKNKSHAEQQASLKKSRLESISFVTKFFETPVDIKEKLKEEINLKKALLTINQKLRPTPQYANLDPFYKRMDLLKKAIENDAPFDNDEYENIKDIVNSLNQYDFYKAQTRQFQ